MWTAFLIGIAAGAAATPHCLGMCGGFPLHLAKSSVRGRVALRQVLFVTGKSFTYIFLGALAGALGVIIFNNTSLASFAPLARTIAGAVTVIFGLLMLGFRLPAIMPLQQIVDAEIVKGAFGAVLADPSPGAAFVLGLGTGFFPCPLPLVMLASAATSHSVPHGMALMAGVGLGTAPGLLAVGLLGVGLDRRFAKFGMRAAGAMVVMIGLLTIGRATGIIAKTHAINHVAPPCCEGRAE